MLSRAVETLDDVLENAKPDVRLRAAQAMIDSAARVHNDAELEAQTALQLPDVFDQF